MEQRPVFNRRHYGTPETFTLIVTNYVVVAGGLAMCVNAQHHIHWFFWVILGLLGLFNIFSVYRYREEYNKAAIIAYVLSLAGLALIISIF